MSQDSGADFRKPNRAGMDSPPPPCFPAGAAGFHPIVGGGAPRYAQRVPLTQ